jgi:DNA invertase Pin-like site-specific DNA recombinase
MSRWRRSPGLLPSKVEGRHLDRQAVVYVRQSTMQQLEQNRESTAVQYALVDRACHLGWARPRVAIIDDDLGCSAASATGRPGFQRMVAEVGLGQVGLILGFEVSRLARSCRDWYQLLEICALAGTLIGDNDGIYDPGLYNDRLLLGLKGTMSEAELHIMRARFEEGRWNKAERGEFGFPMPRGFLRRPSGEVVQDADERARDCVQLVFEVFEKRRSLHGVVRYFHAHGVQLPDRLRGGPAKGDLVWRPVTRSAVLNVLTNPAYAGAYAYGRQRPPATGRSGRSRAAVPGEWQILLKDRWPGYIGWDMFERNQRQLRANQSKHVGVARGGPSLLAGILVCGRCGSRMVTAYRNNGRSLRYDCTRRMINRGEDRCQGFAGEALDALVADLVVAAVRPGAVEVALQLAEDVEIERAREHRQWALRLEQARYETERAQRQYDEVEPENRLVARTLERRWEAALDAQTRLEDEHARFQARQPTRLSAAERTAIERLAADVPAIWRAATTTPVERKEIVRFLLERVVATVEGDTEHMSVECQWAGGCRTRHRLRRSVRRLTQMAGHGDPVARMTALFASGQRPPSIARALAAEGWLAPHGSPVTEAGVRSWLERLGLLPDGRHRPTLVAERNPDEFTVAELSVRLQVPQGTIYRWLHKGLVPARKVTAVNHELWLVRLDDALDHDRRRRPRKPTKVTPVA